MPGVQNKNRMIATPGAFLLVHFLFLIISLGIWAARHFGWQIWTLFDNGICEQMHGWMGIVLVISGRRRKRLHLYFFV